MGNTIFPQSPGLKIERTKTPQWKTITHIAASGKETRTALMSYPRWQFSLSYEFLRSDSVFAEYQAIIAHYNNVQGGYDTFLYLDPYDNVVTNGIFGTGDGVTTQFQLLRHINTWAESVKDINGTPSIYIAGVLQTSGYTISNGLVTFTTPPPVSASLTWTGSFFYRVRYMGDTFDTKQFMYDLWEANKVEFISVK